MFVPSARARVVSTLSAALVTVAIVGWLTRAASPGDGGASRPGFAELFFSAQAWAMAQGALDVPASSLPGECYWAGGLCYGYYGLTPSLLRLPLLAVSSLFGGGLPGLTSPMIALAVMVGVVASLLLVDHVWRTVVVPAGAAAGDRRWIPTTAYVTAMVAVGPGSLLLQLLRPAVFEEAIAWSASLAVIGLLFFLRWVSTSRVADLVAATIAFTLSANARPTGAVIALAVGAVGLALLLRDRRSMRRQVAALLMVMLLPLLSVLIVFRLKFSAWVPDLTLNEQVPEKSWWADILATNGGDTFSAAFAPTNLWAYVRPDAVALHVGSDGLSASILRPATEPIAWLPPLSPGSLFVESVASVTALAPLACLLLVLALVRPPTLDRTRAGAGAARPQRVPSWATRLMLAASFAGVLVTITAVSLTNRYLGDFVPGLVLGVALGSVSLAGLAGRLRPWLGALLVLAAGLLAAYGIVVTVAIAHVQATAR